MNNHGDHIGMLFGTIGGTLLSVFSSVQTGDILKTMVLGVVGASTSFVCSVLLKHAFLWVKRKI